MPEVHRTAVAEFDMLEVWLKIARRNLSAAERLVAEIEDRARLAAEFPHLGTSREDYEPGLRSFVVKGLIVFYRPIPEGVMLVRVIPGCRDLPAAFYQ
jgi:toxin ParE1/3/4